MWLEAAAAPNFELPDLMMMIGFFLQASGTFSKKALPSMIDSRYNKMIFVFGSSAISSIKSNSWTSHLLPIEQN